MKNILLFLMLLLSGIAEAQIVNIPDLEFKNKLFGASVINGRARDINGIINQNDTTLDLSSRTEGIYFIKVITEKGMKMEKVVKE